MSEALQGSKDFVAGLPAPVRHGLAIFIGAFVAFAGAAIVAANGVSQLDLGLTVTGALDAGFKALALSITSVGVLAATPLTDAYGVGKEVKDEALAPDAAEGVPAKLDEDPAHHEVGGH